LRGRIVSEYEFREKVAEETNKDYFINDISKELAQSYSSMPYKYDINKFLPRFIKNLKF
jgi:superfamily II helicase